MAEDQLSRNVALSHLSTGLSFTRKTQQNDPVDVKGDTGHVNILFGESIDSISQDGAGSRGKVFIVARDVFKIGKDVLKTVPYVTTIVNRD
jgi:hypothetical protein